MPQLKLASLNVRMSDHLERIRPFLISERPDVFCVQELNELDIPLFSQVLGGATCEFVPMTHQKHRGARLNVGIGIFSRFGISSSHVEYFRKEYEVIPDSDSADHATANSKNFPVLSCDIGTEGAVFRIMTTHFTWTSDGSPSDEQRRDMRALLQVLGKAGEFVLTGDFNAPRGGEIFGALAHAYKDDIPPEYTTSIDGDLHRAGPLPYMVDGLFSTPAYTMSGVKLVGGVSDHMAVVATVVKDTGAA